MFPKAMPKPFLGLLEGGFKMLLLFGFCLIEKGEFGLARNRSPICIGCIMLHHVASLDGPCGLYHSALFVTFGGSPAVVSEVRYIAPAPHDVRGVHINYQTLRGPIDRAMSHLWLYPVDMFCCRPSAEGDQELTTTPRFS